VGLGNQMNCAPRDKIIAAGMVGKLLEWYVFANYGTFATSRSDVNSSHASVAQLLAWIPHRSRDMNSRRFSARAPRASSQGSTPQCGSKLLHCGSSTPPMSVWGIPQDEGFGSQPPSRLEAVAQYADEEEANCDHQSQSCSDSVAAVTPADRVFGSDSRPIFSLAAFPMARISTDVSGYSSLS
jgi:hypothetical protein